MARTNDDVGVKDHGATDDRHDDENQHVNQRASITGPSKNGSPANGGHGIPSRDVKRLVASMVDWYCEALLCLETISCVNQHSRAMHHSSAANCFVEQVLESGHES